MLGKRQMIPAAGLLATIVAAIYMVVQLNGQTTRPTGDFTNAALAEVRDAQGQAVLSGQFQLADEDDDIERKAVLAATRRARRKSNSLGMPPQNRKWISRSAMYQLGPPSRS